MNEERTLDYLIALDNRIGRVSTCLSLLIAELKKQGIESKQFELIEEQLYEAEDNMITELQNAGIES